MNNHLPACKTNFDHYPPPLLTFPRLPQQEVRYVFPRKVTVYEYYAISDGRKQVFTDKDALQEYGQQRILAPDKVSYMNLFINGVLQPTSNYIVEEGKIILKTEDIPLYKSPIILQMVKIE